MAVQLEKPLYFPLIRDKAIIHEGEEAAEKAAELFEAMGLPGGLLPLKDVVEGGWVEETGFVWMVTRSTQKHHFKKADRHCSYDELVTCTIFNKKMKDIHGVKAKDLGLWVPVNEIVVDEKHPDKVTFKSIMGLSRSFPAALYEREGGPKGGPNGAPLPGGPRDSHHALHHKA